MAPPPRRVAPPPLRSAPRSVLRLAQLWTRTAATRATSLVVLELFDGTAAGTVLATTHASTSRRRAALQRRPVRVAGAHHKHSYYVIRNSDHLSGFTDREIEVIALDRPVPPQERAKGGSRRVRGAPRTGSVDVRLCAGLLRIALALDRSHDAQWSRSYERARGSVEHHDQRPSAAQRQTSPSSCSPADQGKALLQDASASPSSWPELFDVPFSRCQDLVGFAVDPLLLVAVELPRDSCLLARPWHCGRAPCPASGSCRCPSSLRVFRPSRASQISWPAASPASSL